MASSGLRWQGQSIQIPEGGSKHNLYARMYWGGMQNHRETPSGEVPNREKLLRHRNAEKTKGEEAYIGDERTGKKKRRDLTNI